MLITNIGDETKFKDTLKYYQKSLGHLAATMSVDEKLAVKKVAKQFLKQHDYFSVSLEIPSPARKRKSFRYHSRR